MRIIPFLLLITLHFSSYGALNLERKTIEFYQQLNKGDSTGLVDFMHYNCRIKHIDELDVWDISITEFFEVCTKFESDYFSEEIERIVVTQTATNFHYVDVYFDFYIEGTYAHSGLDHFCWTTRDGEFKIESVYSSNFISEKPKRDDFKSMDVLMNNWHNDATQADLDAYSYFMTEEFIYLGTDPSERWNKKEFVAFCEPYFSQNSTWDFKTNWRNWYFSSDQKTAWFEESLNTHMEECRGSGVLIKSNGRWQITHYNLSVVIENKKMKKFIKLRRK